MRRQFLTFVLAVSSIGCGTPAPASPSPIPLQPSLAPASAELAPKPSGLNSTASVVPTATAVTGGMTEAERAEWYWDAVSHFGPYILTYDSLREITDAAHLIVRGRVVETREGEVWPFGADAQLGGPWRTVFGIVATDEVLKGVPATTTPGTILVEDLGWPGIAQADLPDGEVILFLMNYAQLRIAEGMEPSPDADDRYYYVRPNGYQCVLRNEDGIGRIVDGPRGWQEAFGPFPEPLDGEVFSDVVTRIRNLVATE